MIPVKGLFDLPSHPPHTQWRMARLADIHGETAVERLEHRAKMAPGPQTTVLRVEESSERSGCTGGARLTGRRVSSRFCHT